MQITAIDSQQNLFRVEQAVSAELAELVMTTDWMNLAWTRQERQETWARRRIVESAIPWINQWHQEISRQWPVIEHSIGQTLQHYCGTAFWIDEPGFTCAMHTDGKMPGSMQLVWQGTGTAFYWNNTPNQLRYQTPATPNTGYIMINQTDHTGHRPLLWHAMLTPVPAHTYRLTSYTWITPQ
jgi:hypothetical protein